MAEFNKGDSVWILGELDGDRIAGEFQEIAEPDRVVKWRDRPRDAAWVMILEGDEDGSVKAVARASLRPRVDGPS